MLEINRDPSRLQLLVLGILMGLFFGLIGGLLYWQAEWKSAAYGFWVAAVVISMVYYAVPPLRKPFYLGWMYATYPIGWLISHLVLATVYYLVLTPIGLILRCCGGDPLERRFEPEAHTYWTKHSSDSDSSRYFRQF